MVRPGMFLSLSVRCVGVAAAAAMLSLFMVASPAHAGTAAVYGALVEPATGTVVPVPDRVDDTIRRAFREVLRREPTSAELRRYRYRMEEDNWSERDIVNELRSRDDYRSYRDGRQEDLDRVIRRAYDDILRRAPDSEGFRLYRRRMLDDGWTEQDIREALRTSPEYRQHREEYADRMITRVYEDILHRAPDRGGLNLYRNRVMNDGWTERDVREALQRSPEANQRRSPERNVQRREMSRSAAEDIVKRAYRNVLKREADPGGLQGFTDRVIKDHWSQDDVEKALRNSDEYRRMRR